MAGPLEGIRVLDLGTYAVGPSAASYLAYLGADVIRIENPAGEGFMDLSPTMHGVAGSYINANMQKRSIQLDLRDDEERQIAFELVKRADVFVENRLPGVMARLGLDYARVSSLNPRIVYVSMPGFSEDGPFAGRPSMDMEMQGLSGFASVEGPENGPAEMFRVYAHLDHTTAVTVAQAVVLGLIRRKQSGSGMHVPIGFFPSVMFMQMTRIAEFFAHGRNPERLGSASSLIAPSQSFRCFDDVYVNISAPDDATWRRLCDALDLPQLADDAELVSNNGRVKGRIDIARAIGNRIKDRPAWWWIRELRQRRVPCAPLYTFQDLRNDPHYRDQEFVVEIETPWGVIVRGGHPWRFSETGCSPIQPAHLPGADRDEIIASMTRQETAAS